VSYSFGPGPWTPVVRAIILANIAVFFLQAFRPGLIAPFGLSPEDVIQHGRIWQLGTYLFLHQGVNHILFNMLIVWMFGVDLERRWGARGFATYYFITGIGAGVSMVLVSLLPFDATRAVYAATTIGASGACYGLLMAWALIFPTRPILIAFLVPVQARYFVMIMGAIAFLSAMSSGGGPVAHLAHLGGLVVGYLYLQGPRGLSGQFRYRMMKWKMERARRQFNVHQGGKKDWSDRVH
jgi:membrane associated rhomboid family serine protease